jgi:hypothetical protein
MKRRRDKQIIDSTIHNSTRDGRRSFATKGTIHLRSAKSYGGQGDARGRQEAGRGEIRGRGRFLVGNDGGHGYG